MEVSLQLLLEWYRVVLFHPIRQDPVLVAVSVQLLSEWYCVVLFHPTRRCPVRAPCVHPQTRQRVQHKMQLKFYA